MKLTRFWRTVLPLALILGTVLAALPAPHAAADGTVDQSIGNQYGAPRAIDSDADASCTDTADRGDLIDFHAYSGSATNGSRWYFAFVIDSSEAMASGSLNSPTYFIILDDPDSTGANGNDNIPFYNSAGSGYSGAWRRNMRTPGTHFIGCYPNNANDLVCDLYDNFKQEVTGVDSWTITTSTLDGRRYVEMALPDDSDVPAYLRDNTTINTMVISTYNSDSWANPIDAVPTASAFECHNSVKEGGSGKEFSTSDLIATAANCKSSGRPTDSGTNDRQCLSLPARTTTTALADIGTCNATNAGVTVNGNTTGDNYTLLTEASFAGPYQGGDSSKSDFEGESAAYRYCNSSGTCTENTTDRADIGYVRARGDAYFLYLHVSGNLDRFGRSGGASDIANLYLAIDLPDVTSGSAEATTTGVPNTNEFPNAPASRYVNFKGWDVDYAVELIWHGNVGDTNAAKLYDYAGSRTWTSTNFTVMSAKDTGDHTNTTPPTASNLYYGRAEDNYEFAIPWAALGYNAWTAGTGSNPPTCSGQCRPTAGAAIKLGAYTTADSNVVSSEDNWDVHDQAPGIGQGGNGLGSHERIGDEYLDTDDNRSTSGEWDGTPYSGATRSTSDKSSSDPDGSDVDTIESYFQFTLAPIDRDCITSGSPLAVDLAAFTADATPAGVTLAWETVSEVDNAGFKVLRAAAVDGERTVLAFVPSANPGSAASASYTYVDTAVVAGQTYWYWLEDVDTAGGRTLHGPVSATVADPTAVELSGLAAGAASAAGVPLAGALLALLLALLLSLAGAAWAQRRRA